MHRDFIDEYRVSTYYGLPELMESAVDRMQTDDKIYLGPDYMMRPGSSEWSGRTWSSWEQMRTSAQSEWPDGVETVNRMRNELAQSDIPTPVSRQRKRRWSEDDGDVSVDRVLAGDSYCYQEVKRTSTHAPAVITLLTNIGGNGGLSATKMFWRSAAMVLLAEKLEDAGFRCEIIAWSRSSGCWTRGATSDFTSIRLKESGESLDTSYLINGSSPWAFRIGVLGNRHDAHTRVASGYGYTIHSIPPQAYDWMGISEASTFEIPGSTMDKNSAISAAQNIIKKIGATA